MDCSGDDVGMYMDFGIHEQIVAGEQPEIYLDLQRFGDEVIQLFQYDVILCVRLKICGLRKGSLCCRVCVLTEARLKEQHNQTLQLFERSRVLGLERYKDSDLLNVRPMWPSPALLPADDEVVLQCTATIHKEQQKLCLAAEGFGNRLCFLESTSNSKGISKHVNNFRTNKGSEEEQSDKVESAEHRPMILYSLGLRPTSNQLE
ncbi:hypothetical protein JEQ12_012869 [Ovis aries]|uniref:Inositol 1,4,5-trisphosphate/ryanodine receptor domain-containing protein n=1 Tax=Ovis aries TaxID=9940 RepID=A0A835ZJV8_SHEEP|nr:hypothetical protein JEQ12_012869 [Ovis aries]